MGEMRVVKVVTNQPTRERVMSLVERVPSVAMFLSLAGLATQTNLVGERAQE